MSHKRKEGADVGAHSDAPPAKRVSDDAAAAAAAFYRRLSAAANPFAQKPRRPSPLLLASASPAQRIYDDPLTEIFSWVDWNELVEAARTCKSWLLAAGKGTPRKISMRIKTESQLRGLVVSPLRSHISEVDLCQHAATVGAWAITQLMQRLPTLHALTHHECVENSTGRKETVAPIYSPRLESLTLKAHSWVHDLDSDDEEHELESTLPAVVATAAGLQSLIYDVQLERDRIDFVSLDCLLRLRHLTKLQIWNIYFSDAQLRIITRLSSLTDLDINRGKWTQRQLERVTRSLSKLQSLDVMFTSVEEVHMAELLRLPSLTQLYLSQYAESALPYIRRIPLLESLTLRLDPELGADVNLTDLREALTGCAQLRTLTIIAYTPLQSDVLSALEQAPQLTSLSIDTMTVLSFDFLQHVPHLTELEMRGSRILEAPLLETLRSFHPHLKSLKCDPAMMSSDTLPLIRQLRPCRCCRSSENCSQQNRRGLTGIDRPACIRTLHASRCILALAISIALDVLNSKEKD